MVKISVITPSIRPEGLGVVQDSLARQSFQSFEWLVEIGIPQREYDLNRAFNRMLRRAQGELIVFYQDYIKIPDNGLEIFWQAHEKEPAFYTAPVGKVEKWGDTPQWDWRSKPEAVVNWMSWEIDWGAAPLEYLKTIGGFDEWLDKHTWSFDNVNVGLRAEIQGYKFKNLPQNKAIALDHDQLGEHPFRKNYNPELHNRRLDELRMGLRLHFL